MLIAVMLAATTFYVSPSGDDGRSCTEAQNISTPRQTLHAGASCLGPGDTLLIRVGVYDEEFFYTGIPSGTSWDAPVTLAVYPGEKVVLRPTTGACGGPPCRVFTFVDPQQYVVLDGLVIDAIHTQHDAVKITCSGSCTAHAHHIRLKDCEVLNAPRQGILGGQDGCEFINLKIHDNGTTDFDHGIYFSGNGNLIEGCEFYRNAGWGIHKYPAGDNNVIRNNRVHDNARVGHRGVGIGLYGGTGNLVYNNLVWGNNFGIIADYGESDVRVYANTVFGNTNSGIYNGADSRDGVIRNNIVHANDSGINNVDPGTAISDNLCESAGTGCSVVGDPRFVDPGATPPDLHLRSDSPAIDRGADLSSAGFTTDFDGVVRPQGAGWDIGAFEHVVPTEPPGEAVVWTKLVGVSASGNNLTKLARTRWGNAGASSTKSLASGDGYVAFTASETSTHRMLGLSTSDPNQSWDTITFAISLNADGRLQIYEQGAYRGAFGTYSTNDVLRVARESGAVKYRRNGTLLYTSLVVATLPLIVDTSLYTAGATLTNAVVSGNWSTRGR